MHVGHQIHSHELGADPNGAGHLGQPGERVADENGGEEHGQVQPEQHPERDARHKMHGQGSGRNERDEQAEGETRESR